MKSIHVFFSTALICLLFCTSNSLHAQVDPSAYANGFLARLTVNNSNQVTGIQPLPKRLFNDTLFLKNNIVVAMRVSKNSVSMKRLGNNKPAKVTFAKDVKVSKPALRIPQKKWAYLDSTFVVRAGSYNFNSGKKGYIIPIKR